MTLTPTPLAFSPGSVTCFFVPNMGASPQETSSPGCGICISDGVTAAVRPAVAASICFNGQPIDFPPVRTVVDNLAPEPVEVFLETPVPLGCGFGISAASSLTTAFALARRFSLEKTRWQLGEIALSAEIQHELELVQRGDTSLRDQMVKFQRRAQEVLTTAKPGGGTNNGRR